MDAVLMLLLGHIDPQYAALFAWALTSSAFNIKLIMALSEAHERFNTFVHELALFNRRLDPNATKADPNQN